MQSVLLLMSNTEEMELVVDEKDMEFLALKLMEMIYLLSIMQLNKQEN